MRKFLPVLFFFVFIIMLELCFPFIVMMLDTNRGRYPISTEHSNITKTLKIINKKFIFPNYFPKFPDEENEILVSGVNRQPYPNNKIPEGYRILLMECYNNASIKLDYNSPYIIWINSEPLDSNDEYSTDITELSEHSGSNIIELIDRKGIINFVVESREVFENKRNYWGIGEGGGYGESAWKYALGVKIEFLYRNPYKKNTEIYSITFQYLTDEEAEMNNLKQILIEESEPELIKMANDILEQLITKKY